MLNEERVQQRQHHANARAASRSAIGSCLNSGNSKSHSAPCLTDLVSLRILTEVSSQLLQPSTLTQPQELKKRHKNTKFWKNLTWLHSTFTNFGSRGMASGARWLSSCIGRLGGRSPLAERCADCRLLLSEDFRISKYPQSGCWNRISNRTSILTR